MPSAFQVPVVIDKVGEVFALLDTGSTSTFVSERIASAMTSGHKRVSCCINTVNGPKESYMKIVSFDVMPVWIMYILSKTCVSCRRYQSDIPPANESETAYKWHGIFYMPSRIDEAGHTKAFGYPVVEHWGESRNVQFRRWDSNRQHISPESNVLPTEPPRFSQRIT